MARLGILAYATTASVLVVWLRHAEATGTLVPSTGEICNCFQLTACLPPRLAAKALTDLQSSQKSGYLNGT